MGRKSQTNLDRAVNFSSKKKVFTRCIIYCEIIIISLTIAVLASAKAQVKILNATVSFGCAAAMFSFVMSDLGNSDRASKLFV